MRDGILTIIWHPKWKVQVLIHCTLSIIVVESHIHCFFVVVDICYSYVFIHRSVKNHDLLGGRFKYVFMFTPKIGEDSHFDEHIFQMCGKQTTNQFISQRWASRLHAFPFNTPKATLDLELVAPLMLSSFVARVVASMLVQHVRREFPRRCGVRMLITY